MTAEQARGRPANPIRGEASLAVGGRERVLRPTFAALVASPLHHASHGPPPRAGEDFSKENLMTAQKGSAFLLKIGDGVVVTHKESGGWRELLSGAGTRSVSVSAAGIFLGSDAEAAIRANALAGTIEQYELSFEDGEKLRGQFLVQRLDYAGDFNGERNYTLQLESSGEVVAA
jgi:predicted secreted protein